MNFQTEHTHVSTAQIIPQKILATQTLLHDLI